MLHIILQNAFLSRNVYLNTCLFVFLSEYVHEFMVRTEVYMGFVHAFAHSFCLFARLNSFRLRHKVNYIIKK